MGTGASFHNFDYFFARDEKKRAEGVQHSQTWHNFLVESLTSPDSTPQSRRQSLKDWSNGPSALASHPSRQEEHLMPLHVIAGAGGTSPCRLASKPYPATDIAMANFEWK